MKLKELRTSKHIALSSMAKEIGISRDKFYRMEEGKTDIPARCLRRLAQVYGVDIEEILNVHMEDIDEERKKRSINRAR